MLLQVGTTCRERFCASCLSLSRISCTVRSLNGWLAGRMLILRAGRSSISVWFQTKATFQSCPTGVRSPWFPHSTKCVKCACGRSWIKNLDPFRISWWGLGLACSAWTSSPFLVESLRKADEWGEKLFVVSMNVASAFDSVSA